MNESARLLVVDDEESNRDMLQRRLERCGFNVRSVESGKTALGCIQNEPYDVVLLDSMMPEMSGLEMLKLLRAVHSPDQLPVIMVTAVSESQRVAEALDLGANDYVTKPIDFPVALARIRSQVARKRTESALRISEERYALAARSANDGLWDWDLVSGSVYYSPRWKAMLGFAEDQIGASPQEWLGRVVEPDRAGVECGLRAHLENETAVFEQEYRMYHRDGSRRWMHSHAVAVREGGRAVRLTGSQSDVTERKTTDVLTGLANRLLLLDRVDAALERYRSCGEQSTVLFLDLDRFKLVNDSLGHVVGDHLLIETAHRIRAALNEFVASHWTAARIGGDEFAVLLENIEGVCAAVAAAERLVRATRSMYRLDGRDIFCSASIGVALLRPNHCDAEEVLRDADTAMYAAKGSGSGRAMLFDGVMRDRVTDRLEIESDMRVALENKQFEVYYQPRVYLATGRICGFEALVRWNHPGRGLVTPDRFISIAEETGMINELGLWVLREACRQMKEWQDKFSLPPSFDVSVNVSPHQCRDSNLVEQVKGVLRDTGLAPSSLQLEITESLLFRDIAQARRLLEELKALGIGLKIDDFGTGYSCLRYLSELPFDSLKIDRSFTLSLSQGDHDSGELVKTILRMAQNLKLEAIAEGVENSEQIRHLQDAGCEFGQGFYFSRPVDAHAAEQLIRGQ